MKSFHVLWQAIILLVIPFCFSSIFAAENSSLEKGGKGEGGKKWKLVWSDEFEGKNIDPKKWDFDLGNGFYNYEAEQWISGWGNNVLVYYTNSIRNAFVSEGNLHIRALKESRDGFGYTSARMRSNRRDGEDLFSQRYGRFEFRAKLPQGKGLWPALWLLPVDKKWGEWAASGEIDVMEARGHEINKVLGTIHYGSRWPSNTFTGKDFVFPQGETFKDFHVYALEWEPGEMRWYVDDRLYQTQDFWWSSSQRDEKGEKAKE